MPTIKAEWHDNRGGGDYAYGFVYFNDDRRVAYTSSPDEGPVVHSGVTGGWDPITLNHVKAAEKFLKSEGTQ